MDDLEERVAALEYVLVTLMAAAFPPAAVDDLKRMAEEKRIPEAPEKVTLLRPEFHGIPSPVVDRIQALFDRLKWARPASERGPV